MSAVMMLESDAAGGWYTVREALGLEHEAQVVALELAGDWLVGQTPFVLQDEASGEVFPCQRSRQEAGKFFVLLSLGAGQARRLRIAEAKVADAAEVAGVCLRRGVKGLELGNGRLALLLPPEGEECLAQTRQRGCGEMPAGALRGIAAGTGGTDVHWRGGSFLDVPVPLEGVRAEILEEGELRTSVRVEARFAGGGAYLTTVTLDAHSPFARIVEEFSLHEGAQVVLDFSGGDLPDTAFVLDATPAYRSVWLHWGLDRQIAALGAWSQQSQLALCDGYAFRLREGGIIGCFTIDGGDWRGNRLNALEAWLRRWRGGDPLTRRLVRAEAKADACYNRERIPERDRSECGAHLCLEGWLGQGRREWGLLVCTESEFVPPAGDDRGENPPESLSHFEHIRGRESYQRTQGLLRRLHIRHGVFPLQRQLALCLDWEETAPEVTILARRRGDFRSPLFRAHLGKEQGIGSEEWQAEDFKPGQLKGRMLEYLRVRVESFWYGAGIASTNPVSSRRIAPLMFLYEVLYSRGELEPGESAQLRAWFSFLAELMADGNYYPGQSAMLPPTDADSLDPTLLGMANQNFYTDVYTIPGTLAQIFPGHPRARLWRDFFGAQLARQMQVHVYPGSGVWEESHTYFQHVLHTLLPLLLRQREDGGRDEFADPRLQRMVYALLRQRTPPDELYAGRRHLVPFGDHGGEPECWSHIWRALAEGFAPHAPQLAANLLWFARETGAEEGRGSQRAIPPAALSLADEHLEGLGAFLRTQLPDGSESLLALRSGAAWGHHHNDEGSLWLYACGRTLLGDAACGEVQDGGAKFSAAGHSRWTPAGVEVQNYLWRFNRGWVVARDFSASCPYVVSFTPVVLAASAHTPVLPLASPIRHWRAVIRLSPGCYLLLDRTLGHNNSLLHFHLTTPEVSPVDAGEGLIWQGAYPGGVRLRLQALRGISGAGLRGTIAPQSGDSRFVTSHLELTGAAGARTSAVLLSVLREGEGGILGVPEASHGCGGTAGWRIGVPGRESVLREISGAEFALETGGDSRIIRLESPCDFA